MSLNELQPKELFDYFFIISEIPRASKHEEKISLFLQEFGKSLGFETLADKAGNVLIKKPASVGYENRKTVILQSHMDMVCDKRPNVIHDFSVDAIKPKIQDNWLMAHDTTLGADNGIGVAAAMAVLADNSFGHGPINALFTVDEETGLTGAEALNASFLQGDILLNLDSEDEGEIFIGCAGGICTNANYSHMWIPVDEELFFIRIDISGLRGGHSGDDINKGFANANKLLVRFLYDLEKKYDFFLCEIGGGSLHNAIPRDAFAIIAISPVHKEDVRIDFNIFASQLHDEYSVTEPNAHYLLQSTDRKENAIEPSVAKKLITSLHALFNGVFAMSMDVEGLVETSSNFASISMKEAGVIKIITSQRSSIESARDNVSQVVAAAFELGGAKVETRGGYPGWKPNVNSEILKTACHTYKELFNKEAKVKAIHAGLECGLFKEKQPILDMISFGPTMRGVHSPDEKLYIPSVELFWRHLVAVLENTPLKG